VVFHNTNESREHFISKCILAQILYQKGHNIYTEGRHKTKKFDVIDLNTYTVYELESNVTTKSKDQKELNVKNSNFSLIIIDLKDLPKNIDDIFNFLNKKII
jgi:tRNA A58 N-methylase Trm61